MRKSRLLASTLAVALAAVALPAGAQTNVDVTLDNPSGSRTVYVEDMQGQALSALDFGTNRSLPFRVRVVDSDYARQDFSVNASMTNLYIDNGGTLDYAQKIASSDVSLGSQTNPLNILGVTASVRPVVNTVTTLTDSALCATLGLVFSGGQCTINVTGLTGKVVEDLTVTVNLSDLTNLPIVPQANETGAFTDAEYGAGVGTGDPSPSAATPTQLRLVSGQPALAPVLTGLDTALGALPLAQVVNPADVVAALQAQFPLVWGLLSAAQIDAILAATDAVPVPLTVNELLSQSGTYMSLPTLNVTVPANAAAGSYKGTLVVTAVQ